MAKREMACMEKEAADVAIEQGISGIREVGRCKPGNNGVFTFPMSRAQGDMIV